MPVVEGSVIPPAAAAYHLPGRGAGGWNGVQSDMLNVGDDDHIVPPIPHIPPCRGGNLPPANPVRSL